MRSWLSAVHPSGTRRWLLNSTSGTERWYGLSATSRTRGKFAGADFGSFRERGFAKVLLEGVHCDGYQTTEYRLRTLSR